MAVNVVLNGVTYSIPEPGNDGWGQSLTDYFVAQASGLLQKAGGTFSLTAEVDFGTTYGLKSAYFKSRATNPATTGSVRLGNTEGIYWRNAANSANLGLLVNASNLLEFNGTTIQPSGNYITSLTGAVTATGPGAAATTISAGAIVNSMISASAAIARSKIASGTASHVVINDGSGVLSSEATLAKSRGGTGADNSSVTFPSSGSIATVPSSGVVKSNGTVLSSASVNLASEVTGTLPLANGGTGQTTKTPAFDALSPTTTAGDLILHNGTNNVRFAIGSDGQVPVVDTSLTNKLKWATLPTGTKNYITYGTFENNATTGWSKLTVGAVDSTTKAVSGSVTLSAAGITTFATTATNPLAGSYSLSVGNASSALTVGQGIISDAYTIDREDQAKVLSFKFHYEAITGASNGNFSGTTSNTLAVWIYDTANSAWIQPSGSFGLTQSSGVGICQGTFQTPSNMTSFRIAVVCINAPSGALEVNIDDITCGPSAIAQGTPVTDPVAYTPIFSAGFGTPSNINVTWSRNGKFLHASGTITLGTVTGSAGTITLPPGLSIDTSVLSGASQTHKIGNWHREYAGSSAIYNGANSVSGVLTFQTTDLTRALVAYNVLSNTFDAAGMNTITGTGETFWFEIDVPVTGWSSQVQMSSDTDTRVVEAILSGSGTSIADGGTSTLSFSSAESDTHGGWNSGTTYTIPVSGYYEFLGFGALSVGSNTAAYFVLEVFKNGSTTNIQGRYDGNTSSHSTVLGATLAGKIKCNAGDTITLKGTQTSGASRTPVVLRFQISRDCGPSQIAASETVSARYSFSGTQTLTGGNDIVDFATKDFDTHGAVTGNGSGINGTWKFTAPVSGQYEMYIMCDFEQTNSTSNASSAQVGGIKNSTVSRFTNFRYTLSGQTTGFSIVGKRTYQLLAGETLKAYAFSNASGPSLSAGYIEIRRVGNY